MRTQTGEILGETRASTPTAVCDSLWWRIRDALHQMLNRMLDTDGEENPGLDFEMNAKAR